MYLPQENSLKYLNYTNVILSISLRKLSCDALVSLVMFTVRVNVRYNH